MGCFFISLLYHSIKVIHLFVCLNFALFSYVIYADLLGEVLNGSSRSKVYIRVSINAYYDYEKNYILIIIFVVNIKLGSFKNIFYKIRIVKN